MGWWQYLLLVNLYLVLFYGFYALLLRRETFFHLNRIYLVSSAIFSFFIPVIHSDWVHNLFITQKVQDTISVYGAPILIYHFKNIQEHHLTVGQVLLIIYAVGSAILIARFIWQLISLKRIIEMPESSGAFSFFKNIKLGANLDNLEIITAHEQAHASQWHSVDILLIEAICIINWFNPIVYFYRLEIKHIHEFIADRKALENGIDKAEYALLLLSQTFKTPHQLVNPFFNHSLLKQRIIMLQKNRSRYIALAKYGLSAPLFVLMMVFSSISIGKTKTVKFIAYKAAHLFQIPALELSPAELSISHNTRINIKSKRITPDEKITEAPAEDVSYDVAPAEEKKPAHEEPVFITVEKDPEFKGGMTKFYQFLSQNITYPEDMLTYSVQGKVCISMTVEKNGSLSDFKVVKDIGYGAATEAIRVLKLSPKWEPGYQNGQKVRVRYTLPINFNISKEAPVNNDNIASTSQPASRPDKVTYQIPDTVKTTGTTLIGLDMQRKPLYLIDGKEVPDLNNLNPDDIAYIKVVKQPAEVQNYLTQYGKTGLNIVVCIQTKKDANKQTKMR